MLKIALPEKINYEAGEKANRGRVVVEPLFPGYGITLGNALRRVLLSSLPGAAPIGVKIDGIDHEFQPLLHLKEDTLEFIMNLKRLNLKVHSEEPVKLELAVHGKKEVTAADISKNSQVEIMNKDLVLGTITDMAGQLKAEITVAPGMGYETLESREKSKDKEAGYIELDSIFSPVIACGIRVENVRVGKMTNWEKLILDITTDGTMTVEEAFNESVNILIEQFNSLLTMEKPKEHAVSEDSDKAEDDKEEKEEERPEDEEGDEEKPKRGRPKKES